MLNRTHFTIRNALLGLSVAAMALATPALAQRDPGYQAARDAGQVGEQRDGYLGVVGSQSAAVQALAADINIRRRANYAERAQAQGATLQEYAFTQGCILILQTRPGEKYQAPDGSWQTRGSATPQRDTRCP